MQSIASTQENFNWLVIVGKKEMTINQQQYETIVEADKRGNVKMVHFKDFSINLAYVSYMEKIKKQESYNWKLDPYVNGELDRLIASQGGKNEEKTTL